MIQAQRLHADQEVACDEDLLVEGLQAFDEARYLLLNPDVVAAIQQGIFRCGREHYARHGRQEHRPT